MKDASLDLETLRFFNDLLETGALCKSAERLGMSQSAASRALERLRLIFDDRLFIKSGTGMTPTPRAETLHIQVRHTLEQLEALVSPAVFEPAQSTRAFAIAAAGNAVAAALAPALPRLLAEAPQARLDIFPPASDLFDRLRDGRLDLALYAGSNIPADCHQVTLTEVGFSIVTRRGHPLTAPLAEGQAPARADIERYRRVVIHVQGGLRRHMLEEEAEAGLPPEKTAINTQYFFIGPMLLLNSDLIAVLPNAIAHRLADLGAWVAAPTPWQAPQLKVHLVWHHRVHGDPAVRWLRHVLVATARGST